MILIHHTAAMRMMFELWARLAPETIGLAFNMNCGQYIWRFTEKVWLRQALDRFKEAHTNGFALQDRGVAVHQLPAMKDKYVLGIALRHCRHCRENYEHHTLDRRCLFDPKTTYEPFGGWLPQRDQKRVEHYRRAQQSSDL